MVINQGDVFWADLGKPFGSEPAGLRPVVVVQSDLFNERHINTVVIIPLTTRKKALSVPGNVSLKKGEGNLPRACVAISSHISTVDRSRLGRKEGTLSRRKMLEVLEGIDLVLNG